MQLVVAYSDRDKNGVVKVVVTGSSGHLGEALVRVLGGEGHEVTGLDVLDGPFTSTVGSILDEELVREALRGASAVIHAATLHKPHIGSHSARQFIDTNVIGTLALLGASADAGLDSFVYVSTTSAFGRALTPPPGAPAAWVTEETPDLPKNIYGVTKRAAEELCELFHRDRRLPVVVLRMSRFFPEDDDAPSDKGMASANLKVNELLHRRVELADAVSACRAGMERAPSIGFGRYIVSATTPFGPGDRALLRTDPGAVVGRRFAVYEEVFGRLGWRMTPSIDRVYVNSRARRELGWEPLWDFGRALGCLADGRPPHSRLADLVGAKGYHRGGGSD